MEVIKFLVFFPCYSEAEIQVTKLPSSTDYTQGKKHPGKYSQICRVNYILFLKFCPHKENYLEIMFMKMKEKVPLRIHILCSKSVYEITFYII